MSQFVIIIIHSSCDWGLMKSQIAFGLAEVSEYLHPEGTFNAPISGSFFLASHQNKASGTALI